MKYPLIIMVPILMILDYIFTIIGAYFFTKHVSTDAQAYELNSAFKKSVEKLHLFDLHHLLSTAVVTAVLIIVSEKNLISFRTIQFLVGALSVPLAGAVGRNVANILTLSYAQQHALITQDMHVAGSLSIKTSQYHMLFLLVPLLVLACAQPSPFIFGGIVSTSLLIFWHQFWLKKDFSV